MERITHWIDGQQWSGTPSDRQGDVWNPADGQLRARVDLADGQTVRHAVATAAVAFAHWRETSLARRTEVLFAFRDLVHRHRDEIAGAITDEHGKVLDDARGEVARGLEVVDFACGIAHLLKGEHSESVSTGVDSFSLRQPLGVVGVITPFNFPAMVPLWFIPLAVGAGNCVVLKPSERTPSAAMLLAQLWSEAGLPPGVINVVHGDRTAVDELLVHPDVRAISFVGSTAVAQHVYATGTAHGKRVQALGGAKNHMVVMPDADLDLAADAAVNAGFGSAGERCMAVSAVVAVGDQADELVARIAQRMGALRTGDGRRGCDMGPLITREHRDRVASYLTTAAEQGAEVVVDGRTVVADGDAQGFWLGPSLLDRVTPEMTVYRDEIFGPVLCVLRVETMQRALDLVASHPFGNGAAVFTASGGTARAFARRVEAGMVGVNVPIPVPMAYYSFGGWKSSLFGDLHAHGADGVRFFTRGKVVTQRWPESTGSGASRGGPDLVFPTNL
jgi:malonate-semialdehyde dehydrogenase (acetylating)/methylmalonate-semialdehyde dehydrogenase